MTKSKPAPKKISEPCTSTASDGTLKCVLAARDALGREHTVHATSKAGRAAPQYTTWSTDADGRIRVIEYTRGKRQSERYEGEPVAPPDHLKLCTQCGGVQCEPGSCLYALRPEKLAAPSLADACGKCGRELGEHDGKKCPKPAKTPKVSEPTASQAEAVAPAKVTKIGQHDVHPAAALFPMIGDAEWAAFVADIKTSGQRKKIVRIDVGGSWQVLDGRNRLRACLELGVHPRFRVFGDEPGDGSDPIAFVVSENVQRRHLNETQRAFVGAELVPMYEAQAKERMLAGKKAADPAGNLRQGSAAEHAAHAVNVSPSTIEKALRVNRDAAPEVIAAAKDRGQMKVSAAADLSTLPKEKQREIVEKVGTGEIRSGKVRSLVMQEKKRDIVRTINEQQVSAMPVGPFRVIVADWPWPYENSDQHEGSRGHIPYPPMSIEQAFAMAPELDKLAHEDGCILGFWTTNAFMPEAVRIVEAWGFSWRTIRTWDKCRDGIGTWCRSRTEHLIIAERGEVEHTLNEVSTLLCAARREHSRKPDEAMEMFEQHCSGPMLELFAREPRSGWASWGAEVEKFATEAA